jgi:hypothetical protein
MGKIQNAMQWQSMPKMQEIVFTVQNSKTF